jgi:hypothetical protein
VDTIDGIDVFLPRESILASDEYRDGNPYRSASTKESAWDHFRVKTILDTTIGPTCAT